MKEYLIILSGGTKVKIKAESFEPSALEKIAPKFKDEENKIYTELFFKGESILAVIPEDNFIEADKQ